MRTSELADLLLSATFLLGCIQPRKNVSLMGVPAVVVIGNRTTVLFGSKEIMEKNLVRF